MLSGKQQVRSFCWSQTGSYKHIKLQGSSTYCAESINSPSTDTSLFYIFFLSPQLLVTFLKVVISSVLEDCKTAFAFFINNIYKQVQAEIWFEVITMPGIENKLEQKGTL